MRAGYVESGPDERVYGTSTAWWESPATGQNLGLASAGNSMERRIAQLLDGLKRFQFQLFWDLGFPYFAISRCCSDIISLCGMFLSRKTTK